MASARVNSPAFFKCRRHDNEKAQGDALGCHDNEQAQGDALGICRT
jgi:hypothetical protein